MYHRNRFSHGVRSRNHIHRFQSEVPYLISSLLSQGFPENIEKPRVQLRSFRPRPNDELFIRRNSNSLYRVLKCNIIKTKFLKLWDLSRYSERTMPKRPICQKCSFLVSRPLGHCSFRIS